MKGISTSVTIIVLFAIFVLCFIIGKAVATQEKPEKDSVTPQSFPTQTEEVSEASAQSEKEPKAEIYDVFSSKAETETTELTEKEQEPPERMLFPCGQVVLKEYSQNAVYSETMEDWRAHLGIDYSAEVGTEVICVYSGTVKNVYCDSLWGNSIEIVHEGEIISVYKNLDKDIQVKQGDFVSGGQVIAKVGNSAKIESKESPHLHFEIWAEGVPINPISYIY